MVDQGDEPRRVLSPLLIFAFSEWIRLRPEIEAILVRSKPIRLESDVANKYHEYFWSVRMEEGIRIPVWTDAREVWPLKGFLEKIKERGGAVDFSLENKLETIFPRTVREANEQVGRYLRNLEYDMRWQLENPALAEDKLSLAGSLFQCGKDCPNFSCPLAEDRGQSQPLFYFDEMLEHREREGVHSGWSSGRVCFEPNVARTAAFVLEELGKIGFDNVSRADVDSLGRGFLCLCGHPKYQKQMSFRELVSSPVIVRAPH
jgi:hypothetical protein